MFKNKLFHFHIDESGILHKCFHPDNNPLMSWKFWLGITLSFPLEHLIWSIPPFSWIVELLGIHF